MTSLVPPGVTTRTSSPVAGGWDSLRALAKDPRHDGEHRKGDRLHGRGRIGRPELVAEVLHDGSPHQRVAGSVGGELSLLGEPSDEAKELLRAKRRTRLPEGARLPAAAIPHRVHRAGRDVEDVALRERPALATNLRHHAPGEDLEVLVLAGVEVLERLDGARFVRRLHLEQLAVRL